jgi:hypothetical protein
MKKLIMVAAAFAAACATAAVAAGDPFEDARYDISIRKNAEALAIVDRGAFDINMQTDEGYTLLHFAADQGNLDMVRELLKRGADPTLRAKTGSTASDMATSAAIRLELTKAAAAWKKTVAGLVAASLPSPAQEPGKAAAGGNGTCAAVRAEPAGNGRSPAMRPFLKARDDVWYNHPDELAALLEDCVGVDQRDVDGSTLLMIAAERGRIEAARALLAHGASCSVSNSRGDTAAGLAGTPEMKTLLASCADGKPQAASADAGRKKECHQKYLADAGLCSDTTCKLTAQRKWGQCLKTGNYW